MLSKFTLALGASLLTLSSALAFFGPPGGGAYAPPSSFVVNSVSSGGAGYMTRGADLDGNVDCSTGVMSVWLRMSAGDGSSRFIWRGAGGTAQMQRNTSNQIAFQFTQGASQFLFRTNATFTAGYTWYNILASWDTNFAAGAKLAQIYVNNVSSVTITGDAAAAFNIDYTRTNYAWGATETGTGILTGATAQGWVAFCQYLDFSDVNNRLKFISSAGKPQDLGAAGLTPTGVAPKMFFPNAVATWNTNAGDGGNFSISGTPTRGITSPSDTGATP